MRQRTLEELISSINNPSLSEFPHEILLLTFSYCNTRSLQNLFFTHSLFSLLSEETFIANLINTQLQNRGYGLPEFQPQSDKYFKTTKERLYFAHNLNPEIEIWDDWETIYPEISEINCLDMFQDEILSVDSNHVEKIKSLANTKHPAIWQDIASCYLREVIIFFMPDHEEKSIDAEKHFSKSLTFSLLAYYSSDGTCIESLASLLILKRITEEKDPGNQSALFINLKNMTNTFLSIWIERSFHESTSLGMNNQIQKLLELILTKYLVEKRCYGWEVDFSIVEKNTQFLIQNFDITDAYDWFTFEEDGLTPKLSNYSEFQMYFGEKYIGELFISQIPVFKKNLPLLTTCSLQLLQQDKHKIISKRISQEKGSEIKKTHRLNTISKKFERNHIELIKALTILHPSITWTVLLNNIWMINNIKDPSILKSWTSDDVDQFNHTFKRNRTLKRYAILSINIHSELSERLPPHKMIELAHFFNGLNTEQSAVARTLRTCQHKAEIIEHFSEYFEALIQLNTTRVVNDISLLDLLSLSEFLTMEILQPGMNAEDIIALMENHPFANIIRNSYPSHDNLIYLWESFEDEQIALSLSIIPGSQTTLFELLVKLSMISRPHNLCHYMGILYYYPDVDSIHSNSNFLLTLTHTIHQYDTGQIPRISKILSYFKPQDLFKLHTTQIITFTRDNVIQPLSLLDVLLDLFSMEDNDIDPKNILLELQTNKENWFSCYTNKHNLKMGGPSVSTSHSSGRRQLLFSIHQGNISNPHNKQSGSEQGGQVKRGRKRRYSELAPSTHLPALFQMLDIERRELDLTETAPPPLKKLKTKDQNIRTTILFR